ncbi:thiamine biosynthesis enzyme [Candida orthopsilosis Co 90-125]|uniref:Thiamine biosynthesis enzyme n=1 Tax=Candida orthopsilosis (strain 90-125) TaxID=1136231 RepID=H8XAP0_CANO9|nr:thiamine biosynthesis enzyme [Candida orthopsilosis Co 90-125]CCG24890.1 thiamine biosynthesis enzyme [Candida orthopsilosis Co 90-125]
MFSQFTRSIFKHNISSTTNRAMSILKVAYIPEHFSTPLFFAQQQGYYAKYNLSIEFVKVPEGSGRLINLLNNEEVDLAIGLTEAFVADIAKGNDKIKLLDTYVQSPLLWAVSTGSNRNELKNVQDLAKFGKIGISRIGSGSYIMSFVLAHQLGFDKFNEFAVCSNFRNLRDSVNKKQPEGGSTSYEISDAFMWEYFTSKKYYDSGEIKQIGEIYTPWPSWVITASTKAVTTKQQDIHNFISSVNEGIEYFNQHIDEAVDYIASNLDYSAEDARQWTKTVQFNDKVGQNPLDWEKIVVKTTNVLKDAGVLQDSDDVIGKRLDEHVHKTNI